ncbi:site-specific integrase [Streptomyces sp. NPDC060232]|uniref:site-specific integrase n=1 Tax=Streptomyces sp. NPDC060232 TaxID=3347079 RepID=UPI0036557E6B
MVGDDRHAKVNQVRPSIGRSPLEAVELGHRGVKADLKSFDLAEAAVGARLADALAEVLDDLQEAGPLARIHLEDRATDAPLTERTLEIAQFSGRMESSSTTVTPRDERCSPTRFFGPGGSPVGSAGGDRRPVYEPYRLIDPDGAAVEAVAIHFQELLAAGKAPSTVRSYGLDLLRWWRFLQAVDVSWNRATRREARDFSCWIQETVKPMKIKAQGPQAVRGAGAANPVTGKPSTGSGYAPATVVHSETVLRRFYDVHRDAGTGPLLNPFPLDLSRRSGRAHAHHNPIEALSPGIDSLRLPPAVARAWKDDLKVKKRTVVGPRRQERRGLQPATQRQG